MFDRKMYIDWLGQQQKNNSFAINQNTTSESAKSKPEPVELQESIFSVLKGATKQGVKTIGPGGAAAATVGGLVAITPGMRRYAKREEKGRLAQSQRAYGYSQQPNTFRPEVEESVIGSLAKGALGAAAGYGAYKLWKHRKKLLTLFRQHNNTSPQNPRKNVTPKEPHITSRPTTPINRRLSKSPKKVGSAIKH
jgi:hypothetical protein